MCRKLRMRSFEERESVTEFTTHTKSNTKEGEELMHYLTTSVIRM